MQNHESEKRREFLLKFDFLLQKTKNSLIGVDVSSSAVKMVELSAAGNRQYRLESYANVPLPKGSISEGNVNDLNQVADTMRTASRLLGANTRQVVLALPTAAVISKRVLMPASLREDEMEAQVENEAMQYIPFPLDEMNLDFQVLGPLGKEKEATDVEVLIVAAKKEKIDDRVAVAEEAGLKVVIMDVDAYATEMAFTQIFKQLPDRNKHTVTMILDIGATVTHINVMVGQKSVYAREQAFGGAVLSQEIQRRFGLSAEEAEVAIRTGGLPDSYDVEVLQPFVQSLAGEVIRAISFFTNSTQYGHVDHLLLAGGVSSIPGLAAVLQQKTGVHSLLANPFADMQLSGKIKPAQLATDAPALMIACGLALRGVGA